MGSNNAKPKSALQKFQAGVFSSNSSNEIQVGDGRVDGFAKLTEKPDNLVYLFGEDQDGMKIVSFDPIKYELKRKRVFIFYNPKNNSYPIILTSKTTQAAFSYLTTKSASQVGSIKTLTGLPTNFTYTTQ